MEPDKALGYLGLAHRKGSVVFGTEKVLKTLPKAQGGIVFLAQDAGANLHKKIHDKAAHHQIRLLSDHDSATLSKALGRNNIKVCLLLDEALARQIE